ncbi:MAG TPA: archease [Candidatus Acidoferrum sp.]|nr:archease [Candidatus Acidoferrum sp.]
MKQKGYKFVSHTADVELIAVGRSASEAFKNAALALFDTSADISKVRRSKGKTTTLKIKDKADNLKDLLWFMLQDVLSMADSKGVYGYKVKKMQIKEKNEGYFINAEFFAKPQNPKLSVIYVKGVSRFDLKVIHAQKGFKISAVLDV